MATGLLLQGGGCSREFYRKRADKEVEQVLADKDRYPAWRIENFHVFPDPRARFAATGDPNHPPKPPDDPAAYDLSPNPQKPGKAGVARVDGTGYLDMIAMWDRENRERVAREDADEMGKVTAPPAGEREGAKLPPGIQSGDVQRATSLAPAVEEPKKKPPTTSDSLTDATSRTLLDITGRPTFLLTLDQAAELAMFNSREYQDRRENLYLAALPVTQERFSFTSQLFAGSQAIRESSGPEYPGGPSNRWSINNGTGLSKVFPTGGLLLLNFSNDLVFNFLNSKTFSTSSVNFSAVQPLLRGGGQAVALESLTQVERNLLYQIRTFARFRKELYVEIASSSGASISGSSFQPSGVLSSGGGGGGGLGGSTSTPGVIPGATTSISGPILPPSAGGSLALAGAIAPPPSGYLNTMLQNIQIYIDKENIAVLGVILQRYKGMLEGDIVGPLQVQSVEQQLLAGRSLLLGDQQQYLDAMDGFKLAIGVPTNLNIEMDDSVIRPLTKQFRRSRAVIEQEQDAVMEASRLIPLAKVPEVRNELRRLLQVSLLVKGTAFANNIRGRLAEWEKMTVQELRDRLDQIKKETQKLLDLQAEMMTKDVPFGAENQQRLKDLGSQTDLGNYERSLRLYESAYTDNGKPKKQDDDARQRVTRFRDVISLWQKILVEARDERWAAIRQEWPELPRCCVDGVDLIEADLSLSEKVAGKHAVENRFDLMNVRAQTVDSWRQIAVFGNSLLGVFNAGYQYGTISPSNVAQPLNLGGGRSTSQLTLNMQLPLVRVRERNNYRASLIAFQRQRRALQEAEDIAMKAVRSEIHLLRVYAESYRIQQRQLELAYLTIDSSLEALQAPAAPGPARGGDGPAALTSQLLSAQRTLPTAQNNLLTIWINYLNTRLQLYRDLEMMPLDARGVWIDEIRACDCSLQPELHPEQLSGPVITTVGFEQRSKSQRGSIEREWREVNPPKQVE